MSDWVDVCAEDELSVSQYRIVDVEDVMVAVFNINGQYCAIEDVCSHDGAPIAECGKVENGCIECPRHGARFDLQTGEVLAPPAYEPLTVFPVRVAQGRIEVRDDRWD